MSATTFQPKKQSAAYGPQAFDLANFTIGAKVSTIINVAVQLQNARAINLAQPAVCRVFLSDAATGLGITATALTTPPAIGTNGSLLNIDVTGKMVTVESDASGRFDLNLIQSASPVSYYMVVVMPDGGIAVSTIITF